MIHITRHKAQYITLTIFAIIGLFFTALPNAHALIAGDPDGFDTGGDPPTHSWTDSEEPNTHTRIFDENKEGVTPLERRANPPGVYENTTCEEEALTPNLSVCKLEEMANQIHGVVENYVLAFMRMTEQFTAVMMHQVFGIGMFMDADMQMDTQREIQTLVARAHKDYHPSEQMCRIGTFIRSVADTEERIAINKRGVHAIMMDTYLGKAEAMTARGYTLDMKSRIQKFVSTYCDPASNNNGLKLFCEGGGSKRERYNSDIDYQRVIDSKLTLDIDYTNTTITNTEEDITALGRNLYWPKVMPQENVEDFERKGSKYSEFRNLVTMNSVAHNSFAHIIAMKGQAEIPVGDEKTEDKGWYYMRKLMKELGVTKEEDLDKLLGKYPSYYAQMEMLTKKAYQDPDFYTNLYDKPQNVRRMSASLDAIKLIQGQDRFESALRREMLISTLLEQSLEKHRQKVNALLKDDQASLHD